MAERMDVHVTTITRWTSVEMQLPKYLSLALMCVMDEYVRDLNEFVRREVVPFVGRGLTQSGLTYWFVQQSMDVKQYELARIVGVTKNTIGSWISSNTKVHPAKAEAIRDELVRLKGTSHAVKMSDADSLRRRLDVLISYNDNPFHASSLSRGRELLGLRTSELASLVWVSPSTISLWERTDSVKAPDQVISILYEELLGRIETVQACIASMRGETQPSKPPTVALSHIRRTMKVLKKTTPTDIVTAMNFAGLSREGLAGYLHVPPSAVAAWLDEDEPIPHYLSVVLLDLLADTSAALNQFSKQNLNGFSEHVHYRLKRVFENEKVNLARHLHLSQTESAALMRVTDVDPSLVSRYLQAVVDLRLLEISMFVSAIKKR